MARFFYTVAARDGDFTADQRPLTRPWGRVLPDGTAVTLRGPRHGMVQGMTLCGIPTSDVVYLSTAFAPDEPGACQRCVERALAREGESEDV